MNNSKKPRVFKASNSYSTTDIYNVLIKNKNIASRTAIPISVYRDIVNTLNASLVSELLASSSVKLPAHIGELYIEVYTHKVVYDNYLRKYKPNAKVNWMATKKLWLEDAKYRLNKQCVYYNNKHHFIVRFTRNNSKVSSLIRFRLHRNVLQTIGKLVNEEKLKGIRSIYKSSIES